MNRWQDRITRFFDIAIPLCCVGLLLVVLWAVDRIIVAAFGGTP